MRFDSPPSPLVLKTLELNAFHSLWLPQQSIFHAEMALMMAIVVFVTVRSDVEILV